MSIRATIRSVAAGLPELERWGELGVENELTVGFSRAVLLAYAASIEDDIMVVAAWDERSDRLLGLAFAVQPAAPHHRTVVVFEPGFMSESRPTGIWVTTDPSLRPAVTRRLLDELATHATERGAARLAVLSVPDDDDVCRVARESRFNQVRAQDDHWLALPPDGTYESYLAGLRRTRHAFVRDLRRAPEAGARIVHTTSPSDDLLQRCWLLQRDSFARKSSFFEYRDDLFLSLRRRLLPGQIGLTCCWRENDSLLGFALYHRLGHTTQFPYIGHVTDPDLNVYLALIGSVVEHELSAGVRTILLGPSVDTYKRRIGCVSGPRKHLYLGLAR